MAVNWGSGATGALSGGASGGAIGSVVPGIGTAIGTVGGALIGGVAGLFGGGQKKEKIRPQSTLRPEQEPLFEQAVNAGLAPGAGGAFGDSADYYRNLISENPSDMNAFSAPAIRQYTQDIVPGISEQFAGMGSGGLSSSGFRNAQVQGATDLAERLGQIRANLRQSGAQGLYNIGKVGLGNYSENVRNTPQASGWENIAEGVGEVLPSIATLWANNENKSKIAGGNKVGQNSSPYGGAAPSASAKPMASNGYNLPGRTF